LRRDEAITPRNIPQGRLNADDIIRFSARARGRHAAALFRIARALAILCILCRVVAFLKWCCGVTLFQHEPIAQACRAASVAARRQAVRP
jgi:hypothetical protein